MPVCRIANTRVVCRLTFYRELLKYTYSHQLCVLEKSVFLMHERNHWLTAYSVFNKTKTRAANHGSSLIDNAMHDWFTLTSGWNNVMFLERREICIYEFKARRAHCNQRWSRRRDQKSIIVSLAKAWALSSCSLHPNDRPFSLLLFPRWK